ncbi:MAG: DUF4062 domain-containing protein [Lachnospiraceae bacterium]|nr:DUF4062 domain-containing protein [Lachnospiraceae bacterium]
MGRTIRIFISSTFKRFDKLRNDLMGEVFPEIRELCGKNGFSFRVVDLRWGITDDEGRNHQVADICFEEIRRCQEYSPSPNFIVLSDDYYGWIPIPASISSYCWEKISAHLEKTDPASLSFLKGWYREDTNSLEGVYILQDEYAPAENGEKRTLDQSTEEQIGNILFPAAQAVFADDYALRVAFGGSMTEQEINLGLFSREGAGRHTLVMIREAEKAPGEADGRSEFNAHNLNERLKRVTEEAGNPWISLEDGKCLEKARKFLKRIVEEQIRKVQEAEKAETLFNRECRELKEALEADTRTYIEVGNRMTQLREFSEKNRGRVSLVKGRQGIGKSTLLKACVCRLPEQFIGVFADLQGERGSVDTALGFLLETLYQRGMLTKMTPKNPGESSAGYFERQMEGLRGGTQVTLVIDCAEQIYDFRMQDESLFSMELPEGVSLLISCVDEGALSATDLAYKPPVLEIEDIQKPEGLPMLLGMLQGYGRTLSERQQEVLRRALPDNVTPLYLRLLAASLRNVRGYEEDFLLREGGEDGDRRPPSDEKSRFEKKLPQEIRLLLRGSLEKEMRTSLPGLYRHILACVALSAQGLKEEELIEILLRRMPEGSSLYNEILKSSHWEIRDLRHVINVYWARMHFQMEHLLGIYPSNGDLLIRFRHDMMREEALEAAGERIAEESSGTIRDYWMEQSVYISTEPTVVNRRRADELMPALRRRKEKKAIGELLEDWYYLDAMVRLDRHAVLTGFLEEARKEGYAGRNGEALLALLQKFRILLTGFPDSFLPLCVQQGLAGPTLLSVTGSNGYFLYGEPVYVGDGRRNKEEGNSGFSGFDNRHRQDSIWEKDPELQIPGSGSAPMALRGDGIMAVMDRGQIRIYDWNRRRYSAAKSPAQKQNYDFLYWEGDTLVLRRAKSRIRYHYEKMQKGKAEELTKLQEESCLTVIDLFEEKEEKRRMAGSLQEEEAAGKRTKRQISYYGRDGVCRQRMLEYPLDIEIEYYMRFEQAAVVKDREEIDFVNLDTGTVRETMKLANVTGVFFADDGESVLIRTRADSILLHRIADRAPRALPRWTQSEEENRKSLRRYTFRKDFSPAVLFALRKKRDIPWQPETDPAEGTPSPTLTCMSAEEEWFACYYHFNNISTVRVFDLSTGAEILSSETEPVYRRDMERQPFRAKDHGRKLCLRSCGTVHVLDLDTGTPSWSRERGQKDLPIGETERNMIDDCRRHMWRWIPHGQAYESLEDMTNNTFDTAVGRMLFRILRVVLFPLTHALMAEKFNNPEQVYAPQIVRTERNIWLIDPMYRTVHIADPGGKWLCHTQVEGPFSAADVCGDTLYLMSEDKSRMQVLHFHS